VPDFETFEGGKLGPCGAAQVPSWRHCDVEQHGRDVDECHGPGVDDEQVSS